MSARPLAVWHFASAFAISFFGVVVASGDWPGSWGWFVAFGTGVANGFRAANSYLMDPDTTPKWAELLAGLVKRNGG